MDMGAKRLGNMVLGATTRVLESNRPKANIEAKRLWGGGGGGGGETTCYRDDIYIKSD